LQALRRQHAPSRILVPGLWCLALSVTAGCSLNIGSARRGDAYGRTYYIDGAGNWGYGVAEVRQGLREAGYRGAIINFRWSPTLNPALDQTIGRPFAKAKGKELADQIERYLRRFPGNQVNIIALSAGTGVAVWACESLEPPATVHNLILLGSSLSADYDMSEALKHIEGKVYVYYSPNDMILAGPVRTLGTIDGKIGVASAGLVGLHPKRGDRTKIVNIGWAPKYERYGWTGSHTDGTSTPFVRFVLAHHILGQPTLARVSRPTSSPPRTSTAPDLPAMGRGGGPGRPHAGLSY